MLMPETYLVWYNHYSEPPSLASSQHQPNKTEKGENIPRIGPRRNVATSLVLITTRIGVAHALSLASGA